MKDMVVPLFFTLSELLHFNMMPNFLSRIYSLFPTFKLNTELYKGEHTKISVSCQWSARYVQMQLVTSDRHTAPISLNDLLHIFVNLSQKVASAFWIF
jgi:hypothetical protein